MRNITQHIYMSLFCLVTFSQYALADACSGVTWQSSKASVDACLAINPCLSVSEESSASDLERCRLILPCHAQGQSTSDEDKKSCLTYQMQQGKSFYSELYAERGQYTIADSGEMTIELPDNPDGTPNIFVADKSIVGGLETTTASFAAGDTYNDETELVGVGRDDLTNLESGNDMRSQGYQTVLSIQNENSPLPMGLNDPIITNTETAINSIESDDDAFGNCIEVVDNFTSTIDVDSGTTEYCSETVTENYISNGSCEVERKIISPIKHLTTTGGFVASNCGPNCLKFKVALDKFSISANGNKCKVVTASIGIGLTESVGITSAVVNLGTADDQSRLTVGGVEVFSSSPHFNAFVSNTKSCEGAGKTEYYNNTFFTTQASNDVQSDNELSINFETAVGGRGQYEYEVTVRFDRDVSATDEIIRQEPFGCYDDLGDNYQTNGYQNEGYCTASAPSWNCLQTNSSFVWSLSSVLPFYDGGSANCLIARNDSYSCNPFMEDSADAANQICLQNEILDSNGDILQESLCYRADELPNIENSPCDTLVSRPECSVSERECMIEDEETGKCFNWRYSYHCADPESFSMVNSHSRNICDSDIACAGGECDISETETNDDFVNAMSQFSMVQSLGSESICEDPNDPSTCTVWPGEYEYCSYYPVGNDCCEGPSGVSIYDYVAVISGMSNLDNQIMTAESVFSNTVVQDGWQAMREPVTSAYDAVSTSLSNAWSSLSGNVTGEVTTAAGEGVGTVASELGLDTMKQEMTNFVADLMPDALRDVLFEESATVAGEYAMSESLTELTNMFSGVMAIYTAYQMVNLAITLATQCDDNEQDAGLKIAMKQCIKVNNSINGDINNDKSTCKKKVLGVCVKKQHHYCCYNTPLARIVIEQAIPMLNKTLDVNVGEKSCAGLSFDDIQALDWSRINLDEWIGVMAGSGLLPLNSDETSEDDMTGSGQLLNVHGRMTTSERMEDRVSGDDLSNRQDEIWNSIEINNVDCVKNPTLPVCKYRSP